MIVSVPGGVRVNLESLEKAILQLESGIAQSLENPENELLRDGVIQRFKYTMDLSWKMIQRYLKHVAQVEESGIRTKKDLFREAARLGLLSKVEDWFGYDEARNETSHTYDENIAQAVFFEATRFLPAAKDLLASLKKVPRHSS